ncbi:SDR family NAD(P)-dependent oxidoreductase, partial [Bradyrhizobium sp. NBAIM20]
MNVLIIGASRGLGLEFVRQYRAAGAAVVASARDEAGRARIAELGAKPLTLDVASAAGVSGLAWQIDGERFDVVVINAGVFGPRAGALDAPTQDDFDTVMHTNVLGPMRLLPQ